MPLAITRALPIVGIADEFAEAGCGLQAEFGLNTDDPAYLGVDLTGEFDLVSKHLGWTIADAVARVRTAIDVAFCGPEQQAILSQSVDEFVAAQRV